MSALYIPDEDVERTKKSPLKGEKHAHAHKPSSVDVSITQKGLRSQVIDVACILLNITSTVFLVFLNKWYMLPAVFP